MKTAYSFKIILDSADDGNLGRRRIILRRQWIGLWSQRTLRGAKHNPVVCDHRLLSREPSGLQTILTSVGIGTYGKMALPDVRANAPDQN
jgi:hypothetical protein